MISNPPKMECNDCGKPPEWSRTSHHYLVFTKGGPYCQSCYKEKNGNKHISVKDKKI